MKKLISIAMLFAVAVSFNVHAKVVYGNIIRVKPITTERQVPQQVCDVVTADTNDRSAINPGTAIGGIAGALLGSQAGGGNGRIALAALGAVTGALTGDRLAAANTQPQRVCRTVYRTEQDIVTYRVLYEVDGEQYVLTMPFDPSEGGTVKTLPVRMVPAASQL